MCEEETEVTKEEVVIIDFINEMQLNLEVENEKKIRKAIEEKFGDKGNHILEQLNQEIDFEDDGEDCDECGEIPEELKQTIEERAKIMDILLDDSLDDIVETVMELEEGRSDYMSPSNVIEAISRHTDYTKDNVPKEFLDKCYTKVILDGLIQGWAVPRFFLDLKGVEL